MAAKACASLAQVREQIDALDRALVALLADRFAYARQAAAFKSSSADVPAPERVAKVLANVRRLAEEEGAPPDGVEAVYRALIDAMIRLELDLHEKKSHNAGKAPKPPL